MRRYLHAPEIAPEAYRHALFDPLTSTDVAILEEELARSVPAVYADFLQRMNGAQLFAGALSLDGRRFDYDRHVNDQPFALHTANLWGRPLDARADDFFIGGFGADGSRLFLDGTTTVHHCGRESRDPLESWPDLASVLEDLIGRFGGHS